MRKGQKTPDSVRMKQSLVARGKKKNYPVWNKGKKIGNRWPNSGQFKKGHKLSIELRRKISKGHKGIVWTVEQREKNRQGQYRRFKRVIPGYSPKDDGRRDRRKVRLRQNGGFHSQGEWENLKAQYNWTCPKCNREEPGIKLTKDHFIPVFRGGSDNIENIQPLCKSCNSKKGTRIENRF